MRRKVELKCPAENIPNEIIVDLLGTDIGTSIKISSVKLPDNVIPTILDRDFVVATVAAPTVIKEPEKPAEETPAEEELRVKRQQKVQKQQLKTVRQQRKMKKVKKELLKRNLLKRKLKTKNQLKKIINMLLLVGLGNPGSDYTNTDITLDSKL